MKSIKILNYTKDDHLSELITKLNRLNDNFVFTSMVMDNDLYNPPVFGEINDSLEVLNKFKSLNSEQELVIAMVDLDATHPLVVDSNHAIISNFSTVHRLVETKLMLKMFAFVCALFENGDNFSLSDISILEDVNVFLEQLNGKIGDRSIERYISDNAKIDSQRMLTEKRVALITHGIITHGHWAEDGKLQLKKEFDIEVSIKRYSFVTLMLFVIPLFRRKFANDILKAINTMKSDYPGYKYSIIAHSFGTLIVTKALENADELNIDLSIDSLILNGSIVKKNYDWNKYLNENKSNVNVNKLLNICGDSDFLPILSKALVLGTGDSGSYFFSDTNKRIANLRLKKNGHSGMISKSKNRAIWGKFICNGAININESPHPRWHLGLLHFCTRYFPAYFVYLIFISMVFYYLY